MQVYITTQPGQSAPPFWRDDPACNVAPGRSDVSTDDGCVYAIARRCYGTRPGEVWRGALSEIAGFNASNSPGACMASMVKSW
jgi:hypothetical protein